MRSIFLDTVGLIANWDERDQWRAQAFAVFQKLSVENVQFVSSELVLLECANAASRMIYRRSVGVLRDQLLAAGCILMPTEAEFAAAWAKYNQGIPGQPGVVDLVSFVQMRRYGIIEVVSNDRHFKTAGFTTLF